MSSRWIARYRLPEPGFIRVKGVSPHIPSSVNALDFRQATRETSHSWTMGSTTTRTEIPPGTLYMLVLHALARNGAMHGYGIAQFIGETSEDVLRVEEESLYPALQRMLIKGWVKAEWKPSENNRRARYYTLTPAGRKQMATELSGYYRATNAVLRVIDATR